MRPHSLAMLLISLAFLLPGCASHPPSPPPLILPNLQHLAAHYIGSPISGPIAGDPSKIGFDDSLDVRIS